MKYTITNLDKDFDRLLKEIHVRLLTLNQRAVQNKEIDIKAQSCHIIEIIEIIIKSREANAKQIEEG